MIRFLVLTVIVVAGVASCVNSDWHQEREAERRKVELARETPHVIKEAEGCKVYEFERFGKRHYFTRCGTDHVVTQTAQEECRSHGKTRHCETVYEDIETVTK